MLSGCNRTECIEADDFGFASVTVSSRYPDNTSSTYYINSYQNKHMGAWLDTGYFLTGDPLTIMVSNWQWNLDLGITSNNTGTYLSAWSPWFGSAKYYDYLPSSVVNLRTCSFGTSNSTTCFADGTPDTLRILNAPCLMTKGIGLYGLIQESNAISPNTSVTTQASPSGYTFHVGAKENNAALFDASGAAGGIVVSSPNNQDISKYTGGKLFLKILDVDYSDNAGQYIVKIKSGVRNLGVDPFKAFADKFQQILFSGDGTTAGIVPTIYGNILAQTGFLTAIKATLTLYIFFTGAGFLIGVVSFTAWEILNRILKILVIGALISPNSWSYFSSHLFDTFMYGANQIIGMIEYAATGGYNSGGESIIALLFAEETLAKLSAVVWFGWHGIVYIILFIVLILLVVYIYLKAWIFFITAFLFVGVMLALTPIFLCFMLFGWTHHLYKGWLDKLIAYSMQPIILFAALAFLGGMIRSEVYNTLGFKICLHEVFSMSVSDNPYSLLNMYYPETITLGATQNIAVPKPWTKKDSSGLSTKCGAYECQDNRYLQLPYLDPNSSEDAARIQAFASGTFVHFDALIYLVITAVILLYFNDSALAIAQGIFGGGLSPAAANAAAKGAAKYAGDAAKYAAGKFGSAVKKNLEKSMRHLGLQLQGMGKGTGNLVGKLGGHEALGDKIAQKGLREALNPNSKINIQEKMTSATKAKVDARTALDAAKARQAKFAASPQDPSKQNKFTSLFRESPDAKVARLQKSFDKAQKREMGIINKLKSSAELKAEHAKAHEALEKLQKGGGTKDQIHQAQQEASNLLNAYGKAQKRENLAKLTTSQKILGNEGAEKFAAFTQKRLSSFERVKTSGLLNNRVVTAIGLGSKAELESSLAKAQKRLDIHHDSQKSSRLAKLISGDDKNLVQNMHKIAAADENQRWYNRAGNKLTGKWREFEVKRLEKALSGAESREKALSDRQSARSQAKLDAGNAREQDRSDKLKLALETQKGTEKSVLEARAVTNVRKQVSISAKLDSAREREFRSINVVGKWLNQRNINNLEETLGKYQDRQGAVLGQVSRENAGRLSGLMENARVDAVRQNYDAVRDITKIAGNKVKIGDQLYAANKRQDSLERQLGRLRQNLESESDVKARSGIYGKLNRTLNELDSNKKKIVELGSQYSKNEQKEERLLNLRVDDISRAYVSAQGSTNTKLQQIVDNNVTKATQQTSKALTALYEGYTRGKSGQDLAKLQQRYAEAKDNERAAIVGGAAMGFKPSLDLSNKPLQALQKRIDQDREKMDVRAAKANPGALGGAKDTLRTQESRISNLSAVQNAQRQLARSEAGYKRSTGELSKIQERQQNLRDKGQGMNMVTREALSKQVANDSKRVGNVSADAMKYQAQIKEQQKFLSRPENQDALKFLSQNSASKGIGKLQDKFALYNAQKQVTKIEGEQKTVETFSSGLKAFDTFMANQKPESPVNVKSRIQPVLKGEPVGSYGINELVGRAKSFESSLAPAAPAPAAPAPAPAAPAPAPAAPASAAPALAAPTPKLEPGSAPKPVPIPTPMLAPQISSNSAVASASSVDRSAQSSVPLKSTDPIKSQLSRSVDSQKIEVQKLETRPTLAEAKKVLGKHLEDRTAAQESDFNPKGQKASGVSDGYVAARKSDNATFMIKKAFKDEVYQDERGWSQSRSDSFDSMNFVNEFVTAPLYKRMLYDRAPIIEAVKSDNAQSSVVSLRSKFLNKFETVSEFTGAREAGDIGRGANKLKDVQGAEKLFASMLMGGEYDIHAGNIGVMTVKDEQGKDTKVFSKIDHGWSASQFFTDPKVMMENFANAYEKYGYAGKVDLNVSKFKNAVDENLKISDDEISKIVKARTQQLKDTGFDIKGLEVPVWENDKSHDFDSKAPKFKTFNSFEKLEEHYIKHYQDQRKSMQALSQRLGVIESVQHPSDEWKNGQWITDIRGQDPMKWAKKYNKKKK